MKDIQQVLGKANRVKKIPRKLLPGTQIKFGKNGSNYIRSPEV